MCWFRPCYLGRRLGAPSKKTAGLSKQTIILATQRQKNRSLPEYLRAQARSFVAQASARGAKPSVFLPDRPEALYELCQRGGFNVDDPKSGGGGAYTDSSRFLKTVEQRIKTTPADCRPL